MLDIELTAAKAAQYLQDALKTGLSYAEILSDMRRGRRSQPIPHHRNDKGWALYYRSDLDAFIAAQWAGIRPGRHDYLVERGSSELESWVPPQKRVAPLLH